MVEQNAIGTSGKWVRRESSITGNKWQEENSGNTVEHLTTPTDTPSIPGVYVWLLLVVSI